MCAAKGHYLTVELLLLRNVIDSLGARYGDFSTAGFDHCDGTGLHIQTVSTSPRRSRARLWRTRRRVTSSRSHTRACSLMAARVSLSAPDVSAPDVHFCARRRQHDVNPARVDVHAGWLDVDLRPDGPPARLTPSDDARLFAHAGRVHTAYNDAWVGDAGVELARDFLMRDSRTSAQGARAPTISVWLARFHVLRRRGFGRGDAEPKQRRTL